MRLTVVLLSLAVAIAGCGSDDKKSDAGASTAPGTATSTSTTSKSAATQFPGGKTAQGTGYTFRIPGNWANVGAELNKSAVKVDNAYLNPRKQFPQENIVVVRESPPGIKAGQLGAVDETFRGQAATLADSHGVEKSKSLKIDGEPALSYRYTMKAGNGIGRQRQAFAIHDGAVYTITWTAPNKGFADSEQRFNQILASWRWG